MMQNKLVRLSWGWALICVVAACGGGSVSLHAPADVELGAGETLDVPLTVSRLSAHDVELTLAVSGLPRGVEGVLVPTTLGRGQTAGVLRLTATPDFERSQSELTITAAGGALSSSATVRLAVQGFTVSGRILTQAGAPETKVLVQVGDAPVQQVDAEGRFTQRDVAFPYALTAVSRTAREAHRYEGLSTQALELRPFTGALSSSWLRANYRAQISPWSPVSGVRWTWSVEGLTRQLDKGLWPSLSPEGLISDSFGFSGDASPHEVRLHLFQLQEDAALQVTAVTGYGTALFDVQDRDVLELGTVALAPVSSGGVTPESALPPASYAQVCVFLDRELQSLKLYCNVFNGGPLPVPRLPGIPVDMQVTIHHEGVSYSDWWRNVTTAGPPLLQIQNPLRLLAPEEGQRWVDHEMEFKVENPAGIPVMFEFQELALSRTIFVTTAATTTRLPDLSAFDWVLPQQGSSLKWRVRRMESVRNLQAAVSDGGLFRQILQYEDSQTMDARLPASVGGLTQTGYRNFEAAR